MPELPAPVMAWWLQMYRDTQSLPINALQVKKRRHVYPMLVNYTERSLLQRSKFHHEAFLLSLAWSTISLVSHQDDAAETRAGILPHAGGAAHTQRLSILLHTQCESMSISLSHCQRPCASSPSKHRLQFPPLARFGSGIGT